MNVNSCPRFVAEYRTPRIEEGCLGFGIRYAAEIELPNALGPKYQTLQPQTTEIPQ